MRGFGLVLIGAVIGMLFGVLAGAWGLKALQAGGELGDAVMTIKSRHAGQIRNALLQDRCDATSITPHLDALAAVARDLEPAFILPGEDDPVFRQYSQEMRDRIAAAYPAMGDCAKLKEAAGVISDGCKACHRDYKS